MSSKVQILRMDSNHVCKLCQKETDKLLDSHIIAKSIHALSTREEDPTQAMIIGNDPSRYPKRSPIGVYDQFVCAACESIFSPWEQYALEFFKRAYEMPTNCAYFEFRDYEYYAFKLFCISVLWKADASNHYMYQSVNVGEKHREALRQMLLNGTPGSWQDYSVWMEKFNGDGIDPGAVSAIRSPRGARTPERMKFYTFYMAGFRVHIKCDSRPTPDKYEVFMKENEPLRIPWASFKDSTEYEELLEVTQRVRKPYSVIK